VPLILKRFREAVLEAAVSGRLTEECGDPVESWPIRRFGDMCKTTRTGLDRGRASQGRDKIYPYIKMNNLTHDGSFDFTDLQRVDASPEELERYSLSPGDFLFNTRNSVELVGKTAVFQGLRNEPVVLFNNNILRVRFREGMLPAFINCWFCSPTGRKAVEPLKSATTSVAAIYQSRLETVRLPVPSVATQSEIVRRVDELFALADGLEQKYRGAVERVERITPAVLAKAFRGELVPQEPSDEPADVLLERLKKEKVADGGKKARGPAGGARRKVAEQR